MGQFFKFNKFRRFNLLGDKAEGGKRLIHRRWCISKISSASATSCFFCHLAYANGWVTQRSHKPRATKGHLCNLEKLKGHQPLSTLAARAWLFHWGQMDFAKTASMWGNGMVYVVVAMSLPFVGCRRSSYILLYPKLVQHGHRQPRSWWRCCSW